MKLLHEKLCEAQNYKTKLEEGFSMYEKEVTEQVEKTNKIFLDMALKKVSFAVPYAPPSFFISGNIKKENSSTFVKRALIGEWDSYVCFPFENVSTFLVNFNKMTADKSGVFIGISASKDKIEPGFSTNSGFRMDGNAFGSANLMSCKPDQSVGISLKEKVVEFSGGIVGTVPLPSDLSNLHMFISMYYPTTSVTVQAAYKKQN